MGTLYNVFQYFEVFFLEILILTFTMISFALEQNKENEASKIQFLVLLETFKKSLKMSNSLYFEVEDL